MNLIGQTIYCEDIIAKDKNNISLKIKRELGKGGQGVVYLCQYGEKELALKIFAPNEQFFILGATLINEVRRRFIYEKLAKKIDHKKVVKIYHFSERISLEKHISYDFRNTFELPAYTMEVYKQSLRQWTEEKKKHHKIKSLFENKSIAKEFIGYIKQAAEGIAFIHNQKIIHRDIKPGNILLKDGNVAIADFGVAFWRDFARSQQQTISLKMQDPQGTPDYMAPEITNEDPQYTTACDAYSFGLTILRMGFDDNAKPFPTSFGKLHNDCQTM